jgi:preprotein translocase subunit SecE
MAFVVVVMALIAGLDLGFGKAVFWLFNGKSSS